MNKVIVITGPTATGKTKLSIELAKYLNGEIINADSTQIYKELDIATAKVTKEEQENIKHHLIDIKNISEDYTVYDYQIEGRKIIDELLHQNKTPIVVGGTGLYIKALLYDYSFDSEEIKKDFSNLSNIELYNEVLKLDSSIDIHINNRKRLERALNYMLNTNKKYSEQEKTDKLLYDTIFIGLTTNRDILYNKINNRVEKMIESGLLKEAKTVYDSGIRTKAVLTPIGYKELFPYFENKISLEEAIDTMKKNSRHYAKKQYTWFNNQMDIIWFNVDYDNFNKTIEPIVNFIKNK